MYAVKYRVVNPDNNRAVEKEVKFNCIDTKQPIIAGCQDITIGQYKEFDVRYGVYAKTVKNNPKIGCFKVYVFKKVLFWYALLPFPQIRQ